MKSKGEKKLSKLKKKYKSVNEKEVKTLSLKHANAVKKLAQGESPTANNISALLEAEFTTRELCILGSLFTIMLVSGKVNTDITAKPSTVGYQ